MARRSSRAVHYENDYYYEPNDKEKMKNTSVIPSTTCTPHNQKLQQQHSQDDVPRIHQRHPLNRDGNHSQLQPNHKNQQSHDGEPCQNCVSKLYCNKHRKYDCECQDQQDQQDQFNPNLQQKNADKLSQKRRERHVTFKLP